MATTLGKFDHSFCSTRDMIGPTNLQSDLPVQKPGRKLFNTIRSPGDEVATPGTVQKLDVDDIHLARSRSQYL